MSGTLLVLRPEPDAGATAARAEALGFTVRRLPLFATRPVDWEPPDPSRFDLLLLTSANTVRLAGPGLDALRTLPVAAVGQATAEAARQANLDVVLIGSGGAEAIAVDSVAAGYRRALHLAGRERREIARPGLTVTSLTVYAARPQAIDPQAVRDAARDAVALVHSPRAGLRFAELIGETRGGIRVAAISQAATQALGPGWQRVATAARPDDDALLAVAARLCEQGEMAMAGETMREIEQPSAAPRRSVLPWLAVVIAAFLVGIIVTGWAVRDWAPARRLLAAGQSPAATAAEESAPPLAAPPQPVTPAPVAAAAPLPDFERRLFDIETRLGEIDARAERTAGNADRAEGLLAAIAARRAIDRGTQLGYLEGLLRERFGGTQPQAVATIIAASQRPVRLETLRTELDAAAPALGGAPKAMSWWQGVRNELSQLVVVHRVTDTAVTPADRLIRARAAMAAGDVGVALAEVMRLPGRAQAAIWIRDSRRYLAAQQALEALETAALLQPRAPALMPPVEQPAPAPAAP